MENAYGMSSPVISSATATITAALIWHLLYTRHSAKGKASEEGMITFPILCGERLKFLLSTGKTVHSFTQQIFMSSYCVPGDVPPPRVLRQPQELRITVNFISQ